jgi:hypothetical protein
VFPVRYELNLYVMQKKVNRLCGLVMRVPGYRTEMFVFPARYELNLYVMYNKVDRLCGVVIRVPVYRTEMYCVSCEVRTEFTYVM